MNFKEIIKLKLLLAFMCSMVALLGHAQTEMIDQKKLWGKWSCIASLDVEEYQLVEFSNVDFQKSGASPQTGIVHFSNESDEAFLKYEAKSNWVLQGNKLIFQNLKFHNFSIDNPAFDERYHITKDLVEPAGDDVFSIVKLTADELVYRFDNTDFESLGFTVVCDKSELAL